LRVNPAFEFISRVQFDLLSPPGTHKIKKVNLRKQGYDISLVNDPLFFLDLSARKYAPITSALYEDLIQGRVRV